MADGGISLKRTIDILLEDTENPTMLNILNQISEDLGSGKTLADALSRHSAVFPTYFVAMTEAGESSSDEKRALQGSARVAPDRTRVVTPSPL